MALLTILAAVAAGVAIMATADTEDEDTKLAKISQEDLQYQEMVLNKVNYRKSVKDSKGNKKIITGTGYVQKTELDALNLSTVPIPANFAGLEAVMTPTRLQDQLFEIVDVDEEENEVTITARHIWYRNLQNNTLWKPTADQNYTAAAVCRNILTNAIFPSESNVASDCTDTKPGKDLDFERKNLVEAFLDPEKGVCKLFGLSLIRDNMDFYCLKEVGFNRGFVVEAGKNMLGVERQENIENLATRIAPIAKDAKGAIVWLDYNGLKYIDSQYINDYASPRLEIYDTGLVIGKDGVTAENVQEKLLAAAQKRLSDDKVDLPEVTMTVEFVSLGDTEEYKQYRDLDKVYLYDIITVKDPEKGYNYAAQVIGVEHDILTGMLNSVTIGSLQQADASRKIAVWQVPEVDGTNIRLMSLQSGVFAPGAIQGDDIAEHVISYAHFATATIDSLSADAITAVTAQIHEIIAGSITADDITAGSITTVTLAANAITADKIASGAVTTEKLYAGAVTAGKIASGAITTEKLDAYAVTANKIAAGAITTDKLDAGAITADKISATDLSAINAKLGTASIAQAEIAVADINFAHIKDLNASSAFFGQAVFQEAVGGKLYVPRLSVGYAQMLGATIGDLVIQASNGNFYGLDVNEDGEVTATQRTVTAGEIAAGHTSDGRTLVLGTDILATDLSTENIYASHALMNEITAATINVDELWARTAFIGHLMTTDISSNTYIQATIGNWSSGSTITQTINSLNSRISELGYGTIYFQPNEPSHENLTEGDIWVESSAMQDWKNLYDTADDWQDVYNTYEDWQTVCAIERMYVWDGFGWDQMYDSNLPDSMQTEITQLANEISLKASLEQVDLLAGEVAEFSAELTIQAQQIQSAVSAVNLKAASYVMQVDPRTAYTVSVGDIWIKWDGTTEWKDIYDKFDSWSEAYDTYADWGELLGSKSYVWNGSVWVETSDRASEINQETRITQTINQVEILAEASARLGDELIDTQASIKVTNSSIAQEVSRATTAENGKLDKTSSFQTADSIVNEAVRQAGVSASGSYIAKTTSLQTATAIVNEAVSEAASSAAGIYLAKTSSYQTADAIVTEAVRQAATNGNAAYIAKTSSYQSATAIVNEAVRQSGVSANNNFIAKSGSYTSVNAILAEAQNKADAAATTAKNASIAKTQTYQTAQAIVNSAVAQAATAAGNTYIAKTNTYQTADAIVTEAERLADNAEANAKSASIAKTTTYQTAQAIVNAAVSSAASSASDLYIAKTTNYTTVSSILGYADTKAAAAETAAKNASIAKTATYQDASAIVSAAATYTDGKLTDYSTTTQTATQIANYVGNNAYGKVSGITIASSGIDISGSQYVKIASGGYFRVTSGNFGIKSDAGDNEYAIWSGASTAAASQFRVKKNGEVTLTKLMILNESGQETEVNLRTYGLWKLNYHTVKTHTDSGGFTTSLVLSNGDTLNFNSASAVTLAGSWSNGRYSAIASDGAGAVIATIQTQTVGYDNTQAGIKSALEGSSHVAYIGILCGGSDIGIEALEIDARGVFQQGKTAGAGEVTITGISNRSQTYNPNLHTYSVTARATASNGATGDDTLIVTASEAYEQGEKAGNNAARDNQSVVGTCYQIIAHQGDWVKVQEIGTGYSRVPYMS